MYIVLRYHWALGRTIASQKDHLKHNFVTTSDYWDLFANQFLSTEKTKKQTCWSIKFGHSTIILEESEHLLNRLRTDRSIVTHKCNVPISRIRSTLALSLYKKFSLSILNYSTQVRSAIESPLSDALEHQFLCFGCDITPYDGPVRTSSDRVWNVTAAAVMRLERELCRDSWSRHVTSTSAYLLEDALGFVFIFCIYGEDRGAGPRRRS